MIENFQDALLVARNEKKFFWPIHRDELERATRTLAKESIKFVGSLGRYSDELSGLIRVANLFTVFKVIEYLQLKLLWQRKAPTELLSYQDKVALQKVGAGLFPMENRDLEKYKKKCYQKKSGIIDNLLEDFKNMAARKIKADGFRRVRVGQFNPETTVVSTGASYLASLYRNTLNVPAVQVKPFRFFTDYVKNPKNLCPISSSEVSKDPKVKSYLELLIAFLSSYSLNLTKREREGLVGWVCEYLSALDLYKKQAEHCCIPKELWTSSQGITLCRLLSYLVRRNGGRVIGFDHGWGELNLNSLSPFVEFSEVDTFVTYNATHVEYLEKSSRGLTYKDNMPRLVSIESYEQK